MKRIVSLVVATILLLTMTAFAEMDFSSMTDEELHDVIDAARIELTKRECILEEDVVLFSQDGVTLYLTGENSISSDGKFVYIGGVLLNENEFTVSIMNNSSQINGWMSFMNSFFGAVAPGARSAGELQFKIEGTDVATIDDLNELTVVIDIFDKDSVKTLSSTDRITVHFNAE